MKEETIMGQFEKLQESVDKLVKLTEELAKLTEENSNDLWKIITKK